MEKSLSEMTLEELWELFPIFLVPYNEQWVEHYNEMNRFLYGILSSYRVHRISHIGSTAIHGIWAKNIIDILVEIDSDENMENVSKAIESNGFIRMSSEANCISFNRGYTTAGFEEKVYHLHLRQAGDNDELYFRDYLIAHPDIAGKYENLKLKLWKEYEHDRDGYTNAKTEFIQKYTEKARLLYGDKYDK